MPVTTASLFTIQSIRELVTDPLFRRIVVLDSGLVRLDSDNEDFYSAWLEEVDASA